VSAVAEAKGVGKLVKLTREIWPGHPCCLLATTRSWAEQNASAYEGVSLALLEAASFADAPENREAFINAIAAVEAYGVMPRPVLSKAFAPGRADFGAFPHHSAANVAAYLMRKFRLIPEASGPEVAAAFSTVDSRREVLFSKALAL